MVKGSVVLIKLIIRSIFIVVISISLFDCAGNSYKKMSIESPEKLLSIQDSLILAHGDDEGIFDTDSLEEGSSKVENEVDASYTRISTDFHVGNMSKKWYLLNCCITCTEVPINVL